jgi:nogalonic acid methyl ester cyclase / aklanonic acid methyl ester cyclase
MHSKRYQGHFSSLLDSLRCHILPTSLYLGLLILLVMMPSVYLPHELLGQNITEENSTTVARQVINAFNTGDVSNVSDFISEQYFNRESQVDPVRGQLRGPTEFIDTVENLRTAFPDLRHNEEAIIVQGDEVVSVINVTGTHTGNFFILPPTGNEISYEAVHLYKVGEDGKIIEHKAIRDDLTFLAQLGVIKPSSPEYLPFFQALTGTTTNRTG